MRATILASVVMCLLVVSMFPATSASTIARNAATPSSVSHQPLSGVLLPATRTPIKHVIIVIQENHAFDNYFSNFTGAFGLPPGGVPQPGSYSNVTSYHPQYPLTWSYGGNESFSNPEHGEGSILGEQDNGSMDGFFYKDGGEANGLFPSYIVTNSLGLAGEYGVADNYYTDFAGPTLPNRLYYYGISPGTATSDSNPPGDAITVPNLPQELQQNGISWASYDGSYNQYPGSSCALALFPTDPCWYFNYLNSSDPAAQLAPELYYSWLQQEYNSTGAIPQLRNYNVIYSNLTSGTLPSVSWFTSDWTCCTEHPSDVNVSFIGGNVSQGQQSFLELVHAVEDSSYWNSTAIFLTYDEGGGFFDSSPSPMATPMGTGLRVPLIVISPYSKEGYVSHTYLTPSSLLHFVEWNWGLPSLGWLDNSSNLPLGFFNFSETPRQPLNQSVYGSANLTTTVPWVPQVVASGYKGSYVPSLLTNHDVNWTYQTQNVLTNAPVLSSGALYTCGLDGILRSFNPTTGALLWQRSLGSGCRSSPTPLLGGGAIATTLHGSVVAYAASGTLAWNISLSAPIYNNLTLVGSTYYGDLQNGTVFAINGTTHVVQWEKRESATPIYASPVYDAANHYLLLSATGSGVIAINLTGSPVWTAHVPGGTFAQGAICGTSFYVTSPAGGLYPIALPAGTVGTAAALNDSLATPLCSGSDLFVGDNTTFRAFSLAPSLTQLWSNTTHSMQGGSAVASGSSILMDTQGGNIEWFSPNSSTPSLVWNSGTSFFGSPLVTPSWLYFTGEDGNVYGAVTRGEIQVQVLPTNATVSISGVPLATPGGTGTALESPGSYTVSASAPGYATASKTTSVSLGRTSYVNLTLAQNVSKVVITSFVANPSSFTLGNSTALTVVASGGKLPYTYAYSGLPKGCGGSNAANISCDPTSTGTFTVGVNVTDSLGSWSVQSTTFTVNPVTVGAPTITSFTANPSTITLGSSTVLTLTVTGGTPPYTESYSGLPGGCLSSNTTTLSCKPATSGKFTVVATVVDARGKSTTDSVVLMVSAPAGYPTVSLAASPASLVLGNSTTFQVTVTGGTGPFTYAYTSLPTGCTNSNSATLACTPTAVGNYDTYVNVTDANGHSGSGSAPVTVTAPPTVSKPQITSFTASSNPVTVGSTTQFSVKVTGGVTPYSFAYSGLPTGCANVNTSAFTCSPTATGTFNVTVVVTDAHKQVARDSLSLSVQNSPTKGGSTGNSLGGATLYLILAVVVAAVVVTAFLLHRRRKSKGEPAPAPEPAAPATEAPSPSGEAWTEQ